jgi:signal transduction histidine kinase
MATQARHLFWRYVRPVVAPLLLLALALTLWDPIAWWLQGEDKYDQHALTEWIQEAKLAQRLPELVADLLDLNEKYRAASRRLEAASAHATNREPQPQTRDRNEAARKLNDQREVIQVHLKSLAEPITKLYSGQMPLFPVIYRIEVKFDKALQLDPIAWDSQMPRQTGQYRELPEDVKVDDRGAYVAVQYHLRVYNWEQYKEREESGRRFRVSGLVVVGAAGLLLWIYLAQRRERQRQRQNLLAEQQVNEAERLRLQEALRRQDAERRQQEAERVSLELKSQLFANIGIMAGSYAHNIKNLLVRPNDLLNRCLENDGLSSDQDHMLREVRLTLCTVTERLQQILQTVRRDPTSSQRVRLDLNDLAREMQRTWEELAREKWKLTLTLELADEPLPIEGDLSHLQQAAENLLFNARDATFEMRNCLRDQARSMKEEAAAPLLPASRKLALIAAAAWKGTVNLRTRRQGDNAVLEVQDNGIGMSAQVRQRCMEAHFSTKRDNALFAGMNAGMGLGLSFVGVVLEHHGAMLTVESEPLQGATFRVSFPLAHG